MARETVALPEERYRSISDLADRYVCNRYLGPIILIAILFILYEVSIVFGGWLAIEVWPIWGGLENFVADILPQAGFLTDPLLRSLSVWVVKSITPFSITCRFSFCCSRS